jgi:hypothetical protein
VEKDGPRLIARSIPEPGGTSFSFLSLHRTVLGSTCQPDKNNNLKASDEIKKYNIPKKHRQG